MFEKCGLRDIFCKIANRKWVMLIIIILFTCIGAGLFARNSSAYQMQIAAENENARKVYTGYAFYYLSVEDGSSSNSRIKQLASNYISLMKITPTMQSVYDALLEDHTEEELTELLGAYKFEEGLKASELWSNSYKLAYLNKGYILRLTTYAETKTMCKELMKICRKELESIAKDLPDSELTFEGINYVHKTMSDTEADEKGIPGYKDILIWLIIGIIAALLYAVISAVLRPVINRPEDFRFYNVSPAGLADRKTAGVLARLLDKRTEGTPCRVALATSLKDDKKVREFTELLISEWKNINNSVSADSDQNGITVMLAGNPGSSAEASDICSKADKVFTIERKGVTTHRGYDEMMHYLELIEKLPEEAILIR